MTGQVPVPTKCHPPILPLVLTFVGLPLCIMLCFYHPLKSATSDFNSAHSNTDPRQRDLQMLLIIVLLRAAWTLKQSLYMTQTRATPWALPLGSAWVQYSIFKCFLQAHPTPALRWA